MNPKEILTNKENWIFAGAQMTAGLLNYSFQLLAARQLNNVEFGQWSGWLAQFSFFLFVTIWVQSLMTIQGALPFRLNVVKAWIFALLVGGLSFLSVQAGCADLAGWFWMLIYSLAYGLALSHRKLLLASAATLVTCFAKFAIAAMFPTIEGYKWAILFGPAVACLIFLIFSHQLLAAGRTQHKFLQRTLLLSGVFLAVATAAIPQLDLLSAQTLLNSDDLGRFAKVALIYKGVFFFLMILAQVLVTYQVRGMTIRFSTRHLGLLYVAGIAGALLLPSIGLFSGFPSHWITGATMHIMSLSLVFFFTQQESAMQRWPWPALWTAVLAFEYLLARLMKLDLSIYWMIGIVVESLTIIGFLMWTRKSRMTAPA